MEDKVICNKSDLVNTADAIRSKLGVTDTYYVSEFSSAIQSIETGGIVPSGTISITENGTVDVIQYASAEVNVSSSPSLQSKSVTYTANGTATITPDAGYDGLSSVDVTVNVASGGGGGVETCTLTTSVDKSTGVSHGVIYAYSGNTFITIASEGTYSINKNSIIFVMSSYEGDTYTGLDNLFFSFIDHVMVCNVTSDIATYNFVGEPIIEN